MAHVRWEDGVPTEEVRRRCGVKDIKDVLRRSRLRWNGHVRRREDDHVLRRASEQAGKLRMSNGQLTNAAGNVGIFEGMKVEAKGLTRDQVAMLANDGQAVDANPFISLVRRAVNENWIEKGVMHNEQ